VRLFALGAALVAALAGCTDQMLTDALSGAQGRCDEAMGIYATLDQPTTQERALVLAACAETVLD
jgi:hypothetical protein